MNYKRFFAEYFAAAGLLALLFHFWDSASPLVVVLLALAFIILVIRIVVRSWRGLFHPRIDG